MQILKITIGLLISLWTLFYLFIACMTTIDYFRSIGIILFRSFIPSEIVPQKSRVINRILFDFINVLIIAVYWKKINT